MKKFAIFLPQFHEIEENNQWWGKGFTEWTHVKAAKPLYKEHRQPKIPQNGYYNLLDKDTVLWQTNLAKEYGIDGFVYYHYYFAGKLIMEKPAENLLQWKDINQKFFFCWANHTWVQGKGPNRKILIEQTYGDENDWEKHFQYLLPFFKDNRYEKKDGKPLFMIYVSDFPRKKQMLQFFDFRCKQEGFNGIFIIETYAGNFGKKMLKKFRATLCEQSEMVYLREPNVATNIYFRKYPWVRLYHKILREGNIKFLQKCVAKIQGNTLYKILNNKKDPCFDNATVANGVYFEWDNTPRHKNRGYVITAPSKKLFDEYMKKIQSNEYVFINAWNEWAEGMMIEPTEELGTKYLEWLKPY